MRRLRWPRPDPRLVVGILLVVGSLLGGVRLFAAADHTVGVMAAERDLPAGHVVGRSDLAVTRIHADRDVLAALVTEARAATAVGRTLAGPVRRHTLLSASLLGRVPQSGSEITVPVAPEHALGGTLRTGDRVDLLGSFAKGTDAARTLAVAQRVEVVDVVRGDGLFGGERAGLSAITVRVPADDAVFVAFALRNGEVDVARSPSATSVRGRFELADLP